MFLCANTLSAQLGRKGPDSHSPFDDIMKRNGLGGVGGSCCLLAEPPVIESYNESYSRAYALAPLWLS